ncbi:MAG: hypothetical protein H7836_01920 [Magnetococcus sp. YQC-3]
MLFFKMGKALMDRVDDHIWYMHWSRNWRRGFLVMLLFLDVNALLVFLGWHWWC